MTTPPTIRVAGVGGLFFRARDPQALAAWYAQHLGIPTPGGPELWRPRAGITVFSTFEQQSAYFGHPDQQFMFNFRVDDLNDALARLAKAGIAVVKPVEAMDGIGRFAWIADPEGHQIELWEPAPGADG